jgi:hypothetical protein
MAARWRTMDVDTWQERMFRYPLHHVKEVEEAFRLILLRDAESNAGLLPSRGPGGMDHYVPAVLGLAAQYRTWLRPVDTWGPEGRNADERFRHLARHLLADYPVPRLLDSLFLNEGWGHLQHWFRHVGTGSNIRSAPGMTARLTSRMAHYMLKIPSRYSVVQAVRMGQVMGLNGRMELGRALAGSFLGEELRTDIEESWWLTVIQWLVNHPEVPPEQVGPLLDYVRAKRQEDPDFSMKGRSWNALERQIQHWHWRLRYEDCLAHQVFERSGVAPETWEVSDARGRVWSVGELQSSTELWHEGLAMEHCVASYAGYVASGYCSIWSVRVSDRTKPKAERALTLEVRNATREIVQARGHCNRLPTPQERRVLQRWAAEHGLKAAF